MSKIFLLTLLLIFGPVLSAEDQRFYFGDEVRFDPSVPTPKDVLGAEVGDRHLRYDQLVRYLERLAETSKRVRLERIGTTWEQQPMLHLVISAPENLARLDDLRQAHLDSISGKGDLTRNPIVIWMGYSIHGNEPSGANASLLVAYYLAAAEQIADQLKDVVVILEPSLNPDGMNRFATWVNAHRGQNLVADSQSREHVESWPSGRGNHYWFDLNRDWLLQVNPESQARVASFHRWRPNILTDHHEMDTGSTFFFQPGVLTRQNPLTPQANLELTHLLASYHAAALDGQGKLYFTEQSFDDFYFGKGSTYPDIHGCVGILFEQASSRGHLQENSYGPLRFADTIKNQVTTSLSTFKAGYENRLRFLQWQRDDAAKTLVEAAKDPVKAFLIHEDADPMRVRDMVGLLRRHQIEVYALAGPWQRGSTQVASGFLVPVQQAQYRLVMSLFETRREFEDTTFYDVSTWHLPSAFDVAWETLDKLPDELIGARIDQLPMPATAPISDEPSAYAYAVSWQGFYAPRAAYRLMQAGLRLRYATQSFTARGLERPKAFTQGAILVPMGIQTLPKAEILRLLQQVAREDGLEVVPLTSGLTPIGIDLGSSSFKPMLRPEIALLCGEGTDTDEVGSLWHLLDATMNMKVSLLDLRQLAGADLSRYSHIVMADGQYSLADPASDALVRWVKQGGNLVAQAGAINWTLEAKLVELSLRPATPKEDAPKRLPFEERAARNAAEFVSGAAFSAELDLTHPLGYGYMHPRIPMFRTNNQVLDLIKDPYGNPLVYSDDPLLSGYASKDNIERIRGSAAIVVARQEKGSVVLINDPPCFRGFWVGTSKLFLNSLFFRIQP